MRVPRGGRLAESDKHSSSIQTLRKWADGAGPRSRHEIMVAVGGPPRTEVAELDVPCEMRCDAMRVSAQQQATWTHTHATQTHTLPPPPPSKYNALTPHGSLQKYTQERQTQNGKKGKERNEIRRPRAQKCEERKTESVRREKKQNKNKKSEQNSTRWSFELTSRGVCSAHCSSLHYLTC